MSPDTTGIGGCLGIRTVLIATILFAAPTPALAQAGVVVEGRVVEARGAAGIENAIVELEGHRPRRTSAGGAFRFVNVKPGTYTLRVRALGYRPASRRLVVEHDVTVTVSLAIVSVQLDTLVVVAPRTIDLKGRVQDPEKDLRIMGADVVTDQGQLTRTNTHGRFTIEVSEEVPVMVRILAFGYLALDTLLVPVEGDDRYVFDLAVDPLIERMIATEVARIEDRSRPHLAVTMRSMGRERLLWRKSASLADILRAYPLQIRRIRCVFVDERLLSPEMDGPVLNSILARDTERIEFLFRGAMLRVYTREFMRTMVGRAGGLELRRPHYVAVPPPARPICH